MSGALRSVRDFSLPAVCGRVIRPQLSGQAGAAERCGFSGRGKPAAAGRGNIDCVPSEASQGLSQRDFPLSRCENSREEVHKRQPVSRPCSWAVLWGDSVSV